MHKVLKNVSLISQIGIYLYLDCENVFTRKVYLYYGRRKRKGRTLLKIFITTLYLSAFTFGGGYVIVSLMKKKICG